MEGVEGREVADLCKAGVGDRLATTDTETDDGREAANVRKPSVCDQLT